MRLIDADELKKKFNERSYWTYTHEYGDAIPIGWIMSGIDNAPTVDTTCPHCDSGYAQGYSDGYLKGIEERPQGEWIVDYQENEDALFKRGWKCPVCETRNTYGMPPYCMYCGARLEKADGQK